MNFRTLFLAAFAAVAVSAQCSAQTCGDLCSGVCSEESDTGVCECPSEDPFVEGPFDKKN